jgi:hypothetical protein
MTRQTARHPREQRLGEIASRLSYPPTPEISRGIGARLQPPRRAIGAWQMALVALVLLVTALLVAPRARAFIGQYFRVGAVRIFPLLPTPTLAVTATPTASPTATTTPIPPNPTPEPLPLPLADLEGRMKLQEAQQWVRSPILLPSYPPDLGPPDYTFFQVGIPMLISAWTDPADPSRLRLSLYAIDSNSPMVSKFQPEIVEETSVNGQYAVWAKGPYLLELTTKDFVLRRLVEGGTLIWEDNGVTYRLETGLPLEEALKIAESLSPVEPPTR